MIRRSVYLPAGIVLMVAAVACTDDNDPTGPKLSTLNLNTTSVQIVGLAARPTLTVSGRTASGDSITLQSVQWSSDNGSVANVTPNGTSATIVPVGSGTARIRALSATKTVEAVVTVSARVRSIILAPQNGNVVVGNAMTLTPTVDADPGVPTAVTWSTSDGTKASVNSAGVVSGVAQGSATISARSTYDATIVGSTSVNVLSAVTVTPTTLGARTSGLSGAAGSRTYFSVQVPAGANLAPNRFVAMLEGGTGNADLYIRRGQIPTEAAGGFDASSVTAGNNERATVPNSAAGDWFILITSTAGFSGLSLVTQSVDMATEVTSVALTPNAPTVWVGYTVQLTATPLNSAGQAIAGRTVTFTTSDATKATVSGTGLVSGVAVGSPSITATVDGVSAAATVAVTVPPVATVVVKVNNPTLAPGQRTQASAELTDPNGNPVSDRPVTWTSTNQAVAAVSATGQVTALTTGTAMIRAASEGKTGESAVAVVQSLFELNVKGGGTGSGTVASTSGINCAVNNGSVAGSCAAEFAAGTSISLTATPSANNVFSGWGGACNGTGGCTVVMNQAQSVTASFAPPARQTLTVSVSGGGTGSITANAGGLACTLSGTTQGGTCQVQYDFNTPVTLTVNLTGGSTFGGWGGACSGSATTCNLTMSTARTVSATITAPPPPPQSLQVDLSGTGSGSVTSGPGGISCNRASGTNGGTCQTTFAFNTPVQLTAAPTGGSTFGGWGGACTGSSLTCNVTMSQARIVTATFTAPVQIFTLDVTPGTSTWQSSARIASTDGKIDCNYYNGPSGGYSGTCQFNYPAGTTVTLNGQSGSSEPPSWGGACAGVPRGTPCVVTMTSNKSATYR